MDYLESLLNWLMFLGDCNNVNIHDLNFVYFSGGLICFLFVSIIIIMFCKSVSCERFSCFRRYCHWSIRLIVHM